MRVVADATPLRYLIVIEAVAVLPGLYDRLVIPAMVAEELQRPRTPLPVRQWMASPPAWLDIRVPPRPPAPALGRLGAGEREAIVLAETLPADLLVMDDWDGREAARQRGLRVVGTLGVLDAAAARRLIVLPDALARLQATNFRLPPAVVAMLLARDAERHQDEEPPEPSH
jgi:hypothetical protein